MEYYLVTIENFVRTSKVFLQALSLTVLLIGILLVTNSFIINENGSNKDVAKVEQLQGYYIFTDSKPVAEYDYIGNIKVSVAMSADYKTIRDKLIKKASKEYPRADGLIFHFNKGEADKCEVIKFK